MLVNILEYKKNYDRYSNDQVSLVVDNASQISADELLKYDNVTEIVIYVVVGVEDAKKLPIHISKEDYLLSLKEINKIITKAKSYNNQNQIELFARIYEILASYKEKEDSQVESLITNSLKNNDVKTLLRVQGMYGFLIDKISTCMGTAFTLFNVCACAGIESIVINGDSIDKEKDSHSWNIVKLDGNWYNVDLEWDAKAILDKKLPLREFLKANKDFDHDDLFAYYFKDVANKYCLVSFPENQQCLLFPDYSIKNRQK